MIVKTYDIKTAVLVSLTIHVLVFTVTSLKLFRRELDLKDYRVVELVDTSETRPKAPPGAISRSSRPKPAEAPKQTIETSPLPKETEKTAPKETSNEGAADDGGFSSYAPVFKVASLPEFITKFQPVYPAEAKMKGIEAEVIVEIYIDTEGRPRKVVVVKSGGEDFDAATIAAVNRSVFSPAISLDGKPVPVRVRIPFKFELE